MLDLETTRQTLNTWILGDKSFYYDKAFLLSSGMAILFHLHILCLHFSLFCTIAAIAILLDVTSIIGDTDG